MQGSQNAFLRCVGTCLGLAIALTVFGLFPLWNDAFSGKPLRVKAEIPLQSIGPTFEFGSAIGGKIDGSIEGENTVLSAGLHSLEWSDEYRGGHKRSVSLLQLIGPFMSNQAPSCGVSILLSERILDNPDEEKASIASLVQVMVTKELSGFSQWPLGRFVTVESLGISVVPWRGENKGQRFQSWIKKKAAKQYGKLNGHIQVTMKLRFTDGQVPLHLSLLPWISEQGAEVKMFVDAKLKLNNRLYQWMSNRLDGDERVTQVVDEELGRSIKTVLGKPEPIVIEGGAKLQFDFCPDKQVQFFSDHIRMYFSLHLEEKKFMPPKNKEPNVVSEESSLDSDFALEMDENALNALLHSLWGAGLLDKYLARSLVKEFNTQKTVKDYLNLRLGLAYFHLPPTLKILSDSEDEFQLRTGLQMILKDGAHETPASLFAELRFGLAALQEKKQPTGDLEISKLILSCEPTAHQYQACYSSLLEQVQGNQDLLSSMLLEQFHVFLKRIALGRNWGAPGIPGVYMPNSLSFSLKHGRLKVGVRGLLDFGASL